MLRTLREAFPFTVVDATSEYSDHVLTSLELSDAICLVSGLDAIGVRHLSIAMQTLQRLGVPKERLRIVLNRANSKVDLVPEDVARNVDRQVAEILWVADQTVKFHVASICGKLAAANRTDAVRRAVARTDHECARPVAAG